MAKHKPYRIVVYYLARIGGTFLYILPRNFILWLARLLGSLTFYILSHHRQDTIRNITKAFGTEKTEAEIKKIAQGVFQNLAQTGVEVLQFPKLNLEKIESFVETGDAYQQYQKLLDEGKGLVSITSHIGNWELLGGIPSLKGFKNKAVARKLRYHRFHNWIESLRNAVGIDLIYRDESPKVMIRWIRSGGALGLLPDQDIDSVKGVFVDFFGHPAYTSIAPVKLALMTKAPIATVFLIRLPKNRYKIVFGDVIRPDLNLPEKEAIEKYTGEWMKSVENIIRQYPEQWGWMHNRWKTKIR